MNAFDIAAVLIAVAAVSGYVNHRFLHLPSTSGTLLIALVSSLLVIVLEAIQKRALAEGLPYQTLIASLLHKYASGRLKEV